MPESARSAKDQDMGLNLQVEPKSERALSKMWKGGAQPVVFLESSNKGDTACNRLRSIFRPRCNHGKFHRINQSQTNNKRESVGFVAEFPVAEVVAATKNTIGERSEPKQLRSNDRSTEHARFVLFETV